MIKHELLPLTTLRFISAFWVFLFHITLRWPLNLPLPISNILSQGPLGMSIFLILSGFVLTYNYFDKEPIKEYKSFLIKRFARIYPIYILASLITLPLFVIPQTSTDILSLIVRSLTYFIVAILNIFLLQAWFPSFLLQAWFPSLFNYWINGATWSLSVECCFYLLFPNILSLLKKISIKSLKILLFILYFLSIMPGIIFMSPIEPKVLLSTVYAFPIYRLPEFIIGMIAGVIFLRNNHYTTRSITLNCKLFFCFTLLMIYLSLFAHALPLIYVSHNFFAIPIISLIVYYCAKLSQGLIYRILSNIFFVFLGRISYCFYLMQSIPILFVEKNYQILIKNFLFLENHYLLGAIIFTCTLTMSLFVYLFVENPLRRIIINFAEKRMMYRS